MSSSTLFFEFRTFFCSFPQSLSRETRGHLGSEVSSHRFLCIAAAWSLAWASLSCGPPSIYREWRTAPRWIKRRLFLPAPCCLSLGNLDSGADGVHPAFPWPSSLAHDTAWSRLTEHCCLCMRLPQRQHTCSRAVSIWDHRVARSKFPGDTAPSHGGCFPPEAQDWAATQ